MNLIKYDAACLAVATAKSVDEAKDLRDKAEGMRAYARQANNRQLEIDAAEIRIRAERRLGELIASQRKTVGLSGGGRPSKTGSGPDPVSKPTLGEVGIDKHLADRARKTSAVPEDKFERTIGKWRQAAEAGSGIVATSSLFAAEMLRNPDKHGVHFSSETPEHYTPARILDAAIACMGAIDLDPCSNPGEPNVPASRHFTDKDDGLVQIWQGRVFMNPPYGRDIGPWVRKLKEEKGNVRVTQAIALVPARTDTEWFRVLRDYPVCFIAGRLTFVGNSDPAPFPSAVFYLGDDLESFKETFGEIGDIWTRIL